MVCSHQFDEAAPHRMYTDHLLVHHLKEFGALLDDWIHVDRNTRNLLGEWKRLLLNLT